MSAKKIYWLLLYLLMPIFSYGESTVIITLINNSDFELEVENIRSDNPGSYIEISNKIIKPKEVIMITGAINPNFDLLGTIIFKSNASFRIINYRQFRYGQPVFNLSASYIESEVDSKRYNPTVGPRLLSYTAARVVITNSNL